MRGGYCTSLEAWLELYIQTTGEVEIYIEAGRHLGGVQEIRKKGGHLTGPSRYDQEMHRISIHLSV